MLAYSTVYTGRTVNKLMGENFAKAVIAKRCRMAAHMLWNTDNSIYDIISMAGYENKSFLEMSLSKSTAKRRENTEKRGIM